MKWAEPLKFLNKLRPRLFAKAIIAGVHEERDAFHKQKEVCDNLD